MWKGDVGYKVDREGPNIHGCVAYPCPEDRVDGSAFCAPHAKAHAKSAWVRAFRKAQGRS